MPSREGAAGSYEQYGQAPRFDNRTLGHRAPTLGPEEWVLSPLVPARAADNGSPTSVITVLVEANEDMVNMQLLLSKLKNNCKAEV